MSGECYQAVALQVPQFGGFVRWGSSDRISIRAKTDTPYRVIMSDECYQAIAL